MQLTTVLPLALAVFASANDLNARMPEPTQAPAPALVNRLVRRQQTSASGTSGLSATASQLSACIASLSSLASGFPDIPQPLQTYAPLLLTDNNCTFTMAESVSSDFQRLSTSVESWAETRWSDVKAATSSCSAFTTALPINMNNLNCSPSFAVVWTGNQTRTESFKMFGAANATATATSSASGGSSPTGTGAAGGTAGGQGSAIPSPTGNAAALARPELGFPVVMGAIAGFMAFQ